MNVLRTIPFLRIILPFVLGILLGIFTKPTIVTWPVLAVLFVVVSFLWFWGGAKQKRTVLLVIDVFLFVYGINLVHLSDQSNHEQFYGHVIAKDSLVTSVVVIDEVPVSKQKFIKCSVRVLKVKVGKTFKNVDGNCLVYFKRSEKDSFIKVGSLLLIKSAFLEVPPPKNPLEFDYKNYLANKQVYHTLFVEPTAFVSLAEDKKVLNYFWRTGLVCKQILLHRLKNSPLTSDTYAVCAALLTGYDDEIDKSLVLSFSHSGTLHVLSVSGLHTGLIYLVLSFLFDLIDKKRRYKLTRFLLTTFLLWGFALVTGFSAPILRAVIMFTLLGLGKIYFRGGVSNQLNVLLVSAFILLSYNPFYLVDVGFLLSYFALVGLICFQPGLAALLKPEHKIINAVWQTTAASFAATISTLPFTLYYFKQFPIWFFVCNIVVIPATFVMLLLSLLVVVKVTPIALFLNFFMSFITWFIDLFNSPVYGFVDSIDFGITDAVFLTILILFLSISLMYRSVKYLRNAFLLLICWQLTALVFSFFCKNKSLVALYAVKGGNTLAVKNNTQVYINKIDTSEFNYHVKPHLTGLNNPEPHLLPEINFVDARYYRLLLLNKSGYFPDINPAAITCLVIGNNFKLTASELVNFRSLKMIVLDVSNSAYTVKRIRNLVKDHAGISIHDVKTSGAYVHCFN